MTTDPLRKRWYWHLGLERGEGYWQLGLGLFTVHCMTGWGWPYVWAAWLNRD